MLTYQITQGLSKDSHARFIRQSVFIKEQGFAMEFDEMDSVAYHVVLFEDDKPVATGRTFSKEKDPGTNLIGRIAVLKQYRGNDYGIKVVAELEQIAALHGVQKIELSAQTQAQGFYKKLGYEPFGNIYLDEFCPHINMVKVIP